MAKNDDAIVIKNPNWVLYLSGISIVILGWFVYVIITYGSGTVMEWFNVLNLLSLIIGCVWALFATIGRTFIFDDRGVTPTIFGKVSTTIPWDEISELDYEVRDENSSYCYKYGSFHFKYFKDKEMRKRCGFYLSPIKNSKEIEFAIRKLPVDILTDSARAKIYKMGLWVWEEKYETYSNIGRYSDKKIAQNLLQSKT